MKYDLDEIRRRVEGEYQAFLLTKLTVKEPLDEDGYPSVQALELVEKWHFYEPRPWMEFIGSMWHLRGWGWEVRDEIDERFNEPVHRYYISTAGWSGNEAIIHSMQKNHMLWSFTWVESRRGGHYVFEINEGE